jgi:c-di-GMP-binding flagellar brake protein YcgR
MFQEQRTSPRVSMRAQVICIGDSHTTRGVTWNLSETGMQVEAGSLKLREVVRLSFRLPDSGVAIDAVGIVSWEHEKRLGIRFTEVGVQSRRSISQFINEHRQRY